MWTFESLIFCAALAPHVGTTFPQTPKWTRKVLCFIAANSELLWMDLGEGEIHLEPYSARPFLRTKFVGSSSMIFSCRSFFSQERIPISSGNLSIMSFPALCTFFHSSLSVWRWKNEIRPNLNCVKVGFIIYFFHQLMTCMGKQDTAVQIKIRIVFFNVVHDPAMAMNFDQRNGSYLSWMMRWNEKKNALPQASRMSRKCLWGWKL